MLSSDKAEDEELSRQQIEFQKLFDCSLAVKRLLENRARPTAPTSSHEGVKLPKLDVPSFDGNILNWKTFWDQFCISVHNRSNLSDSEKLVYLLQSLKDGPAKRSIEGLSRSGECYAEATDCLKLRYDRPRLFHQKHVRIILEAPPLKDGDGKELHKLHYTIQQHTQALKAMDCEPLGLFLTSVIELKLDTTTLFEWQKHSQDTLSMPHYLDLLEFINLCAQASETSTPEGKKLSKGEIKRNFLTSNIIRYQYRVSSMCAV